MIFLDVFILAVALAMDAFAVALCKGIKLGDEATTKKSIVVGLWFGFFQGLMPLIGYLLGSNFSNIVGKYDHWVAFLLLTIIGVSMIKESFDKGDSCNNSSMKIKEMFLLSIATSIDALAVGVTFAFLDANIIYAVIILGVTTFVLSAFAVKVGSAFGSKFKFRAEMFGGIVLIFIGVKILIESVSFF